MSVSSENNPSAAPLSDASKVAAAPSRSGVSVVGKLALLVGLTLALLLAVLVVGSGVYWRQVLRQQVDAHLSAVAASRRDMVKAQVALLLQRVELNTDRGEVRAFLYELENDRPSTTNRQSSEMSLKRISNGKPIVAAALTNTNGTVLLSTDPAEVDQDFSDLAEFNAGLSQPYMGPPRWRNGRFESVLAAPVRTRSEPERVYGVLFATADVSQLAAAVRDVTGLGETGEAILGVRNGDHLRFLFPPRNAPHIPQVPLDKAPALKTATAGMESFTRNEDYRGVRVLAAARPIGYGGWALVAKIDEREAYAPIADAQRLGILFGIVVGAVGLAAAYALALTFTRPLRQLAQAAARVAGGHIDAPVPVTSKDEIGGLSASFNAMTAAIRARRAERDEAERALRDSEGRSRQIAESLPQLVWTCDANGSCDYLSPQWVEYTGIPAAPQLDSGWLDQVHPDDRETVAQEWQIAASNAATLDVQFRIRRHDGAFRWFRTRAVPLLDEGGHVKKWFGTNTDIDDTKRAEESLREADRRKDEFLAMLGHELRNPLSAIANAVHLWKEAPAEDETAQMARAIIERQTANLSRHVEDLLDVVRISEGKIELRRRPVNVAETIQRAVETVRMQIEEKGQTLKLTLGVGGEGNLDVDPTRIEQVLVNLLTNASKYTPQGGTLTVEQRCVSDDVEIVVEDNGIGIAPEVLPEIFELFTQADRSLERTSGGLGIGLNLCRQLVELHGGSVVAQSAGIGCGARFIVRLPAYNGVPIAPASTTPASPSRNGKSRRILLVDDNADTVRLLTRLLIRRGHEVSTASDGLTALRVAEAFKPDVLLLDIGLPGLDGYSLARRLRANGFSHTPMIAISGYAQESDRAQAIEAGFDHHFAKPVDFDMLAALLMTEPAR